MEQQILEKGLSLVDQIVQGLKDTAPQMADLTLAALRFDAVYGLVFGCVFLLLASTCISMFFWVLLCRPLMYPYDEKSKWYVNYQKAGDPTAWLVVIIISGIGSLAFTITTLAFLTNKYMWAALVDPKLALAMRALDKVLTVTNTK